MGYWKWLKDKYFPPQNLKILTDGFIVSAFVGSIIGVFFVPFMVFTFYLHVLDVGTSLILGFCPLFLYLFFSYTYLVYSDEKEKSKNSERLVREETPK